MGLPASGKKAELAERLAAELMKGGAQEEPVPSGRGGGTDAEWEAAAAAGAPGEEELG